MKFALAVVFFLSSLALEASAHFQLAYPPSRGDNDQTQATSPCGGLDTPSSARTPWGIHGGQLRFVAGHDEADTAVYLAVGNNPQAKDFTIILADEFLQIGLGTFCWNDLAVPSLSSISDGVNATIQVVQAGHTSGGLYNVRYFSRLPLPWQKRLTSAIYLFVRQCADITFVNSPPSVPDCSNSSGISASAAVTTNVPSPTASGSNATATKPTASASATSNAAAPGNLVGGAGVAFVGAVAIGWLL